MLIKIQNSRNAKLFTTFYNNRKLKSREFYRDGKLEGERKCWYENGQLWRQEFYQNDKREGEFKVWYGNGQPWMRGFYQNGKLIDSSFTRNKKKAFLELKRCFRNRATSSIDSLLISDLVKMI